MKKITKTEEKIISIIMKRDDCDREEVESILNEFKEWFNKAVDHNLGIVEIEERFMDDFGLEPDYLHGFVI